MSSEQRRDANLLDRRLLRLQGSDRPWTIRFTAGLGAAITTSDLDDALLALRTARPELSAGLDGERRCWVANDELRSTPESDPDDPIDLSRSGIRVALAEPSRIVLDVNHGFTDGLGGLTILRDLLACLGGDVDVPPRHHVGDGELGELVDRDPRRLARAVGGLAGQVAYRPTRWPASGRTNIAEVEIDVERVRAACLPGTGINDVLVAAVHAGLAQHLGSTRVSVAVPVDLRRLIGSPSGLGNAVLTAATRSIARETSPATMARSIHHQLAKATETSRLRALLGAYVLAARPGAPATHPTRRVARWPETAVCSNLGVVELPGCEWLAFSPPARDLVAIGIATVGEVVTITARAKSDHGDLTGLLNRITGAFGRSPG